MNLKETILAAVDLPSEKVDVPEWGVNVTVRTLTAAERDKFEEAVATQKLGNTRARLVGLCMVDDDGKRIFSDSEVTQLGGKSSLVLDRLFEIASRLNGFTAADAEELEKNSESAPAVSLSST